MSRTSSHRSSNSSASTGLTLEMLNDEHVDSTRFVSGTAHTSGPLCLTPMRLPLPFNGDNASDSGYAAHHRRRHFSATSPSELRQRAIAIQVVDQRFKHPSWMHPNIGGEAQHVLPASTDIDAIRTDLAARRDPSQLLREWPATAIGGNDILSSVLFSAGLTIAKAGKLAPVAQLLVVIVVYCLRSVFEDVVSAVPLNGGCYSALLNALSKRSAAVAATVSIVSYLATGVVCGVAALNYVHSQWDAVPVAGGTCALLLVFALLCVVGLNESAAVALVLFSAHVLTLVVLTISCAVYAIQHPDVFVANMVETALPDVSVLGSTVAGSVWTALLLGYGAALLSVTGFEASAQFVEQQRPGVFRKTLRNMWALSSAFNVAFAALALAVLPLDDVLAHQDVLLAHLARTSAGRWLELWVCVDAFAVLAGAVLTSYVGITGLAQRLALDRALPAMLLTTNTWRNTPHWIICCYCSVAASLVLALDAQVDALAGVFALAFVSVLLAFALACLALKVTRARMPRAHTTSWRNALFCTAALALGLGANVVADAAALRYFCMYAAAVGAVVMLMLERVRLLQMLLFVSRTLALAHRRGERVTAPPTSAFVGSVVVAKTIEAIKQTPVVFFCKAPNLPQLNAAIAYVLRNEQTYCLRLVHVVDAASGATAPPAFEDIVCLFDHIYPLLKVDFVAVTGAFEPALVEWLAQSMAVPTNMMFMCEPTNAPTHSVSALGVRVITN